MIRIKNKLRIIGVITLFFTYLQSCSNKPSANIEIEYYSSGRPKKISFFTDKGILKEMLYYDNGNIKSVTNIRNNLKEGEQLVFFEDNDNKLKSKLLFKSDKANGVAYWYYPSGALKASRNYKDDKEWYLGFDYWDDAFVINKSLLRFNNQSKIYYKLNFDSSGKPINSEGDTLHSSIESIK